MRIGHSTFLNSFRNWEGKLAALMLPRRFKLIKSFILRCPQLLCSLRIVSICLFWRFKSLVTSTSSSASTSQGYHTQVSIIDRIVCCLCMWNSRVQLFTFSFKTKTSVKIKYKSAAANGDCTDWHVRGYSQTRRWQVRGISQPLRLIIYASLAVNRFFWA